MNKVLKNVFLVGVLSAASIVLAKPDFAAGLRAIHRNEPKELQTLIDQGLDVNQYDYFGASLLASAVLQKNNVELVRVLMQAGANTDLDDEYTGESVFHVALNRKSPAIRYAIIRLLVDGETQTFRYIERGYEVYRRPKPEYARWLAEAVEAEDAQAIRLVLCTCVSPFIEYEGKKVYVSAYQDNKGSATIAELKDNYGMVINRFYTLMSMNS